MIKYLCEKYSMVYFGEIAALSTALCWTVTSLAFESASKKVGSLMVNFIRLFIAFILLSIFTFFQRGHFFPVDADAHMWLWLSASALVGFVFGDYFLFKAFTLMSSRVTQLFMTLVPPFTAITGWIILSEGLSLFNSIGMLVTIAGIVLAILGKNKEGFKLTLSKKGIIYAICGALGQAVGLVISKYGMGEYNAFASTQIRILAAIFSFTVIIIIGNKWKEVAATLKNIPAMKGIVIGSIFGPFLGVSFSLLAVQHTHTAIASTIIGTVPILIIIPSVFYLKQKVTAKEIIGACISVLGVVIFFIK